MVAERLRKGVVGLAVVASVAAGLGLALGEPAAAQTLPGTLSGTVRDGNGQPVPSAQVVACLFPGSPSPSCVNGFALADNAGNYTMPLAEGTYNIAAAVGNSAPGPNTQVTIVADETTNQDVTTPAGHLSGAVLDGNGQPFPANTAGVAACPASVPFGTPCLGLGIAFADAAGHYTLYLSPDDYNIAGFTIVDGSVVPTPPVPITIADGEEIRCDATPPDSLTCAPRDGNGDGIPDFQQSNVTSVPNAVDGEYVTVAAPDGSTLVDVTSMDPNSLPQEGRPEGVAFPAGLVSFRLMGVAPGETVEVQLFLPAGTVTNTYYKFHDGWSDFSNDVTGFGTDVLTLSLTNGEVPDDADGDASNDEIVDPGGAGHDPPDFSGFLPPVDNPPVQNAAKAGQAIPVKFSLGGDEGLDVMAAGSPSSQPVACDSGVAIGGVEATVSAGNSGLSYDPTTDQYTYVWKTRKEWSKTCRELVVELADGSMHTAFFRFR